MRINRTIYLSLLIAVTLIFSCKQKEKAPDVSGIQVSVTEKRFDRDFFSLDTNQLMQGLQQLQAGYPQFLPMYFQAVIGSAEPEEIKLFLQHYRFVYDSAQQVFGDMKRIKADLEKAFRYVKYYFPAYELPHQLIPILGRLESMQDLARMDNGEYTAAFMGPDMVGFFMQFYMGSQYSVYQSEEFVTRVAPLYRSRRFSKEYILPDIMKQIADDIFPDRSRTQPLIVQMIEKGKRWWLTGKFLPETPDSIITGYTGKQLAWCQANEGDSWSLITRNEELYSLEPSVIQNYIGESPFTQSLSQEYSPGNIGPWFGRQIIRKYAEANPQKTIDEIMKMPAEQILEGAKYKPR
ncbi:MAG: hypothetical protein QM781_08580 [Chitinophagaceae bacterium]